MKWTVRFLSSACVILKGICKHVLFIKAPFQADTVMSTLERSFDEERAVTNMEGMATLASYLGIDKLPPERLIYLSSIFLLSVSGLGVISITSYNKVNKNHIQLALTRSLWKFESTSNKKTVYEEKCWAWRKLVLAGVMSCSLVSTLTIKLFGPILNLYISAALFTTWMVGILCYWYFVVMSIGDKPITGSSLSPEVRADGPVDKAWFSRKLDVAERKDTRLPLTIITGFLGSGKTTLVKNVLQNTVGMKVLVVENEIGAEGIDHELLMQHTAKEEIILMNNGCVCCTVRKDLLTTFHRLFAHEAFAQLDWIVIETTGMADPAPLIQSLYMDADCQARIRLDSVLTVVDCKHLPLHLQAARQPSNNDNDDDEQDSAEDTNSTSTSGGSSKPKRTGLQALFNIQPSNTIPSTTINEATLQITFADRILMNKTDLVSETELAALRNTVQKINPSAQLIACQNAIVPLEDILNIRAFDPLQNKALSEEYSSTTDDSNSDDVNTGQSGGNTTAPMLIQVGSDGKISRKNIQINAKSGVTKTTVNNRKSKLSPAAAKILANKSRHDVMTVSLVTNYALDLDLFNHWISKLLGEKGGDIYRIKGILWMYGYEEQFVVHGVHMIFDGQRGQLWDSPDAASNGNKPARRFCRLVFIGLGLDQATLETEFLKCTVEQK